MQHTSSQINSHSDKDHSKKSQNMNAQLSNYHEWLDSNESIEQNDKKRDEQWLANKDKKFNDFSKYMNQQCWCDQQIQGGHISNNTELRELAKQIEDPNDKKYKRKSIFNNTRQQKNDEKQSRKLEKSDLDSVHRLNCNKQIENNQLNETQIFQAQFRDFYGKIAFQQSLSEQNNEQQNSMGYKKYQSLKMKLIPF